MGERDQDTGADRAEQERVQRVLEALIRDAEQHATLVAAFLGANGLRPARRSVRQDAEAASASGRGPFAIFLLELAACLRLRQWEHGGLKESIAPALPSAAASLSAAADQLIAAASSTELSRSPRSGGTAATADAHTTGVAAEVFKAAYMRLARAAAPVLHADVLLPGVADEDGLIEQLASFLWEHRRLAGDDQSDNEEDSPDGTKK